MDALRALAFGLMCIAAVLFILSWFGVDYCGTCGGWGREWSPHGRDCPAQTEFLGNDNNGDPVYITSDC